MNKEIWKDIKGFENKYQISSEGRVMSLNFHHKKIPQIRKTTSDKDGYPQLILYKNGKPYRKVVHRLVAEAFVPKSKNKFQVNHKNGIKNDNRVENLEWCNNSENHVHAFKIGLKKNSLYQGEKNGSSKLKWEDVKNIRKERKAKGKTQKEIAKMFGVSRAQIGRIINNENWKCL